jgi:hypothetical protein
MGIADLSWLVNVGDSHWPRSSGFKIWRQYLCSIFIFVLNYMFWRLETFIMAKPKFAARATGSEIKYTHCETASVGIDGPGLSHVYIIPIDNYY